MVRSRIIQTIKYGQFREAVQGLSELGRLCEARGLSPATFWSPLAGANNELVIETEYASLADMERETAAFYADADIMNLWRSVSTHVIEGSGRSELLETAPVLV